MGMIAGVLGPVFKGLFGDGRNALVETAEVFRVNAEAASGRGHDLDAAVLAQLGAEFAARERGGFDRMMDGVNRLPRPLMVLGLVWMLVETARDPQAMSEVFAAWAVLPEAAWVVFGIVVTFYFGGRAQLKEQEFRRGLAEAAVAATRLAPSASEPAPVVAEAEENAALAEWRAMAR